MIPQQTVTFGIGTDIAIVDAHRTLYGTLCPRVLVVEDNALLAIELERLLDEVDCEVCTIVNTAPAALVAAAIHQPDLVLLDLCGSDAQQIAAQIHRDPHALPGGYAEAVRIDALQESSEAGVVRLAYRGWKPTLSVVPTV